MTAAKTSDEQLKTQDNAPVAASVETANQATATASTHIQLTADEIKVRKEQDVRSYFKTRQTEEMKEEESQKLARLAKSLILDGQLEDLVVRPEGKSGDKYSLIAGHRRLAAAALIDSGAFKSLYNPAKQGKFPLNCTVKLADDEKAKKMALMENIQRKNYSAMELAAIIQATREEKGWGDDVKGWDAKTADYLGLSRTTITQSIKLLNAPKDIQKQVHEGLSAEAALTAINQVEEAKRAKVLADAKKQADKEAAEAQEKKLAGLKKQGYTEQSGTVKKAKASPVKPVVTKSHVQDAARKAGALKTVVARDRKSILRIFDGLRGAASPKVMAEFAEYLVDKFAEGHGTEGDLIAMWDKIADAIPELSKPVKGAGKAEGKDKTEKAA